MDARLKVRPYRMLIVLILIAVILVVLYSNKDKLAGSYYAKAKSSIGPVHLVAVSCGKPDYLGRKDIRKPFEQTLTMVKSAVLFAQSKLHVHIFTENDMMELFKGELNSWPLLVRARFHYTIYSADYAQQLPEELVEEWKKWYKPCGSFRLFLPLIMKNITDAAIYSDSDVVFVKPIDRLWENLLDMSVSNVAAISPTAGHPLGGSKENVMLLNFKKILAADWKLYDDGKPVVGGETMKYGIDLLLTYYRKYKDSAEHDQKLLNIMYHFNPELLYQLPCTWNFKTNFCIDDNNVCASAEEDGASAVHGIAGGFFNSGNQAFKGLYETFLEYNFDADLEANLYEAYQEYLEVNAKGSYCGSKAHIITDSLRDSIKQVPRW